MPKFLQNQRFLFGLQKN